jgi:hypothetical protein
MMGDAERYIAIEPGSNEYEHSLLMHDIFEGFPRLRLVMRALSGRCTPGFALLGPLWYCRTGILEGGSRSELGR